MKKILQDIKDTLCISKVTKEEVADIHDKINALFDSISKLEKGLDCGKKDNLNNE